MKALFEIAAEFVRFMTATQVAAKNFYVGIAPHVKELSVELRKGLEASSLGEAVAQYRATEEAVQEAVLAAISPLAGEAAAFQATWGAVTRDTKPAARA